MRLIIPYGKQQFDPFYGCTVYPICKGARNCDIETGAALLTDKELEEKRLKEWRERVDADD